MSPSADEIAKKIGRDLKVGDILTARHGYIRSLEVVNPRVPGEDGKDLVEVAELTPHGPVQETNLYPRTENE